MDIKYGLLTDLHFGFKSNNLVILEHQKASMNWAIDEFIDNNVNEIIILGDAFDNRILNNTYIMTVFLSFITKLSNTFNKIHILVGNHDMYYKENRKINIINLLLFDRFDNVNIINEPTEYDNMLLMPWICNNIDLTEIKNTKCKIMLGHLEINGFNFNDKGKICSNGLKQSMLNKFDLVLSGHFHSKQKIKSIHYLGTIMPLTFGEYNSEHGIHILENGKLHFIENVKYNMLSVINYENREYTEDELLQYKDKIVKVIVKDYEAGMFDKFLIKLGKIVFKYDVIKQEFNITEHNEEDTVELDLSVSEDNTENVNKFLDTFLSDKLDKEQFIKIYNIFLGKLKQESLI